MRAILGLAQADRSHPFIHQARMLPSAHVVTVIHPGSETGSRYDRHFAFPTRHQRCPNIGGKFELNGTVGLLLNYRSPISNIRTDNDIADLDLD